MSSSTSPLPCLPLSCDSLLMGELTDSVDIHQDSELAQNHTFVGDTNHFSIGTRGFSINEGRSLPPRHDEACLTPPYHPYDINFRLPDEQNKTMSFIQYGAGQRGMNHQDCLQAFPFFQLNQQYATQASSDLPNYGPRNGLSSSCHPPYATAIVSQNGRHNVYSPPLSPGLESPMLGLHSPAMTWSSPPGKTAEEASFDEGSTLGLEAPPDDECNDKPYAKLIYEALMQAPGHRMMLREIYNWFQRNTNKPRESASNGWQNSIRHNLSMNQVCNPHKQRTSFLMGFAGI